MYVLSFGIALGLKYFLFPVLMSLKSIDMMSQTKQQVAETFVSGWSDLITLDVCKRDFQIDEPHQDHVGLKCFLDEPPPEYTLNLLLLCLTTLGTELI